MRKQLALVVILASVAAAPEAAAGAAEDLTINLAAGTAQTLDVDSHTYRIVLESVLPASYTVAIGPAVAVLPPPMAAQPFAPESGGKCTPLDTLRADARRQTSEEGIQALITGLMPQVRACAPGEQRAFARETRREHTQTFAMSAGTTRTVTIKRLADAKLDERSWVITLRAPERGRWLTTYGVGFTPDRGHEYFLTAVDDRFQIAAQRNEKDALNYIPAVFFTWVPRSQQLNDLTHGPTAGLGFESKAPAVFAGYQWTWNYNLGVMAGVAIHPHKRLRGNYSGNDIVTETLTDEQLHHQVYAPNVVLAFTFRLGANPFGAR